MHPLQLILNGCNNNRSEMAESPYLIRFIQLPTGQHEYTFRIDDTFFKDREGTIIHGASIEVDVVLHKSSGAMQLELKMKGEVTVDCMRCLEAFVLPIEIDRVLLVRMVETPTPEEDDIDAIHIAKTAYEIDLKNHLYDFLTLEVPYSPVHEDLPNGLPGCNPEILKHIKQLNKKEEEKKEEKGDDRWSVLRKIKLN